MFGDKDEGFIAAVSSLLQSAKRPIILTLSAPDVNIDSLGIPREFCNDLPFRVPDPLLIGTVSYQIRNLSFSSKSSNNFSAKLGSVLKAAFVSIN